MCRFTWSAIGPHFCGAEISLAPGVAFDIMLEGNTGSPPEGGGGTLLGPLT